MLVTRSRRTLTIYFSYLFHPRRLREHLCATASASTPLGPCAEKSDNIVHKKCIPHSVVVLTRILRTHELFVHHDDGDRAHEIAQPPGRVRRG